jgi:hypothetical protein
VNRVFQWLYSDLSAVSEVIGVWIQALNDFTKKSVAEVSDDETRPLSWYINTS